MGEELMLELRAQFDFAVQEYATIVLIMLLISILFRKKGYYIYNGLGVVLLVESVTLLVFGSTLLYEVVGEGSSNPNVLLIKAEGFAFLTIMSCLLLFASIILHKYHYKVVAVKAEEDTTET